MSQIHRQVYLFASLNEYSNNDVFYFTSLEPKVPQGYVLVSQTSFLHEEPSRPNLVAAKVARYREEIQQARVDAELVAREKGEAIQNLLAITHEEPVK